MDGIDNVQLDLGGKYCEVAAPVGLKLALCFTISITCLIDVVPK